MLLLRVFLSIIIHEIGIPILTIRTVVNICREHVNMENDSSWYTL